MTRSGAEMKIRLHEPTFGEEEIAAVVEVLRSTQVTQGKKVREFENEFCPGAHVVACNSGSSANLLAISALVALGELRSGDEVMVPALCWSTTVFPIIQHNLIPVFVDCDIDTLNIDPEQAHKAFEPSTKAIMPVHVYGNPCDMGALQDLPISLLVGDCCEAMGAEYQGAGIDLYGDVTTFSTYFSHHITTLEGGLVVTYRKEIADLLRIQRSHGWLRDVDRKPPPGFDPGFAFVELGYNLRMTEVQAAIGIQQLPKLEEIVRKRRATHRALREGLSHIPWLRFQKEQPGGRSSCFGFTILLADDAPADRKMVRMQLEQAGIETRPIICGNMARQPVMSKYQHRSYGNLPNATRVMERGFSIGCHQDVTLDNVSYVIDTFNSLVRKVA